MGLTIRSKNNIRFEQWKDCGRCGRRYPLSWLRYQRNEATGVTSQVCIETCYDKPGVPIVKSADQRTQLPPVLPQVYDSRGGED